MSALREVGGWDPYNVTEDADLGIRLMRHGYECQTITLPTMEEAPPYLIPWIKQRTRWVKGWMQTILVHNRNPTRLVRELGLRNTVAFHLLLTSIIVSSLIHPIALGLALYELNQIGPAEFWSAIITGFGIFNIVAGYTTYVLFADLVLRRNNFRKMSLSLLMLPLYWLLISISGWRALIHLLFVPHQWEKTPHGLSDKSDD
jgi:cellulose synthase/poly-beta-1,6-N-acetylglucosamine synthase-like glycosyltransferase